jgi:abscisic-aldehyde oxidase
MDMKNSENQTSLIFAINGDKFELSNIDPSTTLLEFLRTQTRFKSVKLGCGEGIFIIIIHNSFFDCK